MSLSPGDGAPAVDGRRRDPRTDETFEAGLEAQYAMQTDFVSV